MDPHQFITVTIDKSHILNLARLITQEISLMKDPKNPRQAFERQSKLLRDAFIEKGV
ncbi:MAG: hypothetical protein HY809_10340 [Nitrospirae bacterium]|nr:hypothetical protein [Nitrospirota bacterium]